MWIDSHCHLNHNRNAQGDNPAAIIARAKAAGVEGMVNISCQIAGDFPDVLKTAQAHENVWCSIGTHPNSASDPAECAISMDDIVDKAKSEPKIIGIGESGLDYYYETATVEDQQSSFRKHIQACIAADLPLIVHARDADEDIMRIIREEGGAKAGLRGVMHCFSSSRWLAEEALKEDFYISFSGIVTFKNAKDLQEIAKIIPQNKILVETDAPFLAPTPYRGQINEPAFVAHTGQFLADLLNLDEKTMASHSKNNFFRLFTKAGTS